MAKNKTNTNSPSRPGWKTSKDNTTTGGFAKLIGALFLPVFFAYIGYQAHDRYVRLPALISTKSNLPPVLSEDHFQPSNSPELYWGSYRSNLYFGLRTRSPNSPLIGLMWYEQPINNIIIPHIRHWCDQTDNLISYGWIEHDGRSYGVQDIEDDQIALRTSFVKRSGGKHGGDWTARISASPTIRVHPDSKQLHSIIVYVSLGSTNSDGSYLRPNIIGDSSTQTIETINGFTPELGSFMISIGNATNLVASSFLAARIDPQVDLRQMKELIIKGTRVIDVKSEAVSHYLGLSGYLPIERPPTDQPNVLVIQVTFLKSTTFDVIFESGSVTNRQQSLTGEEYDSLFTQKSTRFNHHFEQTFRLTAKGHPEFYRTMGRNALSNMLGSIGYFHGSSTVKGPYNIQPVPYGPLSLFTAVPSRSFFPRGFLWDEGFHHLLLRKFDSDLSLEILSSWLDLMNVEGWIPREVILGEESEHKVPAEFIVQLDSIANPPMFFFLIDRYLSDRSISEEQMRKIYPRLKLWYNWLNRTQIGPEPFTYRWRGRNSTTDLELNPKTLPSGLDDYPRASHPTDGEYHVDLLCWMAKSSQVMATLAERLDNGDYELYWKTAAKLYDPTHLDARHWSEKTGRYSDYGLHTRNVKLVRKAAELGPDGRPKPGSKTEYHRQVFREPQTRLVSDTFGYVSLFPLFLHLIPVSSPKLGRILDQLTDTDLLWTPYGLRSLAKTSPLYNERNTEHDPPYWRGSIWINMNFMALSALQHYSKQAGAHQATAFRIYSDLRAAVVANIAREYKRTGYLWEHYNDETGNGEGSHPFTGWTSLVLLMLSEQFA